MNLVALVKAELVGLFGLKGISLIICGLLLVRVGLLIILGGLCILKNERQKHLKKSKKLFFVKITKKRHH
jgi:hypothetical protein